MSREGIPSLDVSECDLASWVTGSNFMFLLKKMELAVTEAMLLIGDPRRRGGSFCLAEASTGKLMFVTLVGQISDPAKAMKYFELCQEKAKRLYLNRSRGHRTSWESRDEEQDRYAGAILGSELIFSFSGFPPDYDEAAMLVTAIMYGQLATNPAVELAAISQNDKYERLLRRCGIAS